VVPGIDALDATFKLGLLTQDPEATAAWANLMGDDEGDHAAATAGNSLGCANSFAGETPVTTPQGSNGDSVVGDRQ
jgi:hypothetical protein